MAFIPLKARRIAAPVVGNRLNAQRNEGVRHRFWKCKPPRRQSKPGTIEWESKS
jgi:hypothetical protein